MNNQITRIGRFEIWGVWTEELLPAITLLLERYEPLLPRWCEIALEDITRNAEDADSAYDHAIGKR